jgi:hypothetical protein
MDRQRAVDCTEVAAGDRRIDELQPALDRGRTELAGDVRGRGRVVDEDRAAPHAGERAIGAEHDRAQVVVVADAGEDDVRAGGGFAGRCRAAMATRRAVLGEPLCGFRRAAVVDADAVPGACQVPRHRMAHHAEAEKSDRARRDRFVGPAHESVLKAAAEKRTASNEAAAIGNK